MCVMFVWEGRILGVLTPDNVLQYFVGTITLEMCVNLELCAGLPSYAAANLDDKGFEAFAAIVAHLTQFHADLWSNLRDGRNKYNTENN
jgi:hypothetical protein